MKQRKSGTMITMSSAAARRPHPGSPIPYAAAKAGIQILTQDVAAQAGPFGSGSTALLLKSSDGAQPAADTGSPKADAGRHAPHQTARHTGDVARAALFLASEEAAWITGVILDVAGGAVMA